ncbi:MAG: TolC family protein [Oscillatoria sp. SIO1A7]|nr:TolC family protein [Oscillatoria sp. SIO1A7]
MPTLRYLKAMGMGVLMAFSVLESSASLASETRPPDRPDIRENDPDQDMPLVELPEQNLSARPELKAPERLDPAVRDIDWLSQAPDTRGNRVVETPPPVYLESNPNPLQFPTVPEEVRIEGNQPLTLEQVIELAQRNNRDLQESLLNLERSGSALREARAALYPNLDVRSNFTRTDSANIELNNDRQRNLFGENTPTQDTGTTALDGTVELTYDVFTSGLRPAQIKAAEGQVRFDQLEVERLSEQIRFDVTDAYYDVQQADEDVRIARAAVGRFEQNLKDAEALERAGVGTKFDVLQARVDLANAKQDLTQGLSQQRVTRRDLARLLSLPQWADISAADPVEPAGQWSLSLEETIVLAFKNRAELEQELVQRDIGDQQRRAALAALGPQLNLFANYNVLEVLDDDLGVADGYSLGARLQWNVYDGGASKARAAQQETNIEIAETRFANQRNQVRFQVEQSYFDLQFNRANIQTAKVALDEAKERLRLARLRFQAGVGTQTEVIDAVSALTQAEGNLTRATLNYNRALASIKRAVSNIRSDRRSSVL